MNNFVSKLTILFPDLLHSRLIFLPRCCKSVVTKIWKFMEARQDSLDGLVAHSLRLGVPRFSLQQFWKNHMNFFHLSLFLYSTPVWHRNACPVNFLCSLSTQALNIFSYLNTRSIALFTSLPWNKLPQKYSVGALHVCAAKYRSDCTKC